MRKHIQLPAYLQDNELYETIRVALIEYFPGVNADKLHFDFVIEATTNEMHNILLLAVFKENLQQLLTIVAAAGLQVTILDIDIYACTRAATWYLTREQPTVKVAVIIVLHGATANFILWQHGQCVFAHSWQLTTASRFVAQVQQAWLLAQAALPAVAVDFIGINGNGHNLTQLAHELQLEFAVTTRVISILKNCNIAAPVSAALVAECSNKVLLCWGLAMRALPR